jgi:flagellar hook assembly protein FlgD
VTGGPAGPGPAGGVALAGVAPNPAAGGVVTTIRLRALAPGTLRVAILDAAGRSVRTWRLEVDPSEQALAWDGRDDRGRASPAGVYLVRARLEGHAGAASTRLVRLGPARL